MITKIKNYINHHQLFSTHDKLLVACSGGVDSMVLLHILQELNYTVGVAHCNFKLRGDESDADEDFVISYAKQHQLAYYTTSFHTLQEKKKKKESTQMTARALRYNWLETIRKENNFSYILTAHHTNDQAETILLNLTKGTGISGLKGMLPKSNAIVRPLLSITKNEIIEFAKEHKIVFREDASNNSDAYQRNYIRHQVIPKLQEINPEVSTTLFEFSEKIADYNDLVELQLAALKKKCWQEIKGIIYIKINYIKQFPAAKTILFNWLSEYGFNADQVSKMLYQSAISKEFLSATHRVILDRANLIIVSNSTAQQDYIVFDKIPNQINFNNYKIDCSIVPIEKLNIKKSSNYAYVDADKLEFPMLIRYLKTADYFYPFGMNKPNNNNKIGKKKIAKYFRDEKLNSLEKESTPILFSNEKTVWLVGHRIDARFQLTANTKRVLKFKIIKQ